MVDETDDNLRKERIKLLVAGKIKDAINVDDVVMSTALSGTPMHFNIEVPLDEHAETKPAGISASEKIKGDIYRIDEVQKAMDDVLDQMDLKPSTLIFANNTNGVSVSMAIPVAVCMEVRTRLGLTGNHAANARQS